MAWSSGGSVHRSKSVPGAVEPSKTALIDGFPSLPAVHGQVPVRNPSASPEATVSQIAPALSYRTAVTKSPRSAVSPFAEGKDPTRSPSGSPGPIDFPFLSDPGTVAHLRQPGTKLVLVLRGVSGSGKSTLCTRTTEVLGEAGINVDIVSADHFFTGRDGVYRFVRENLSQAHESCQAEFQKLCTSPQAQVIIVDNTNIVYRDFVFYLQMAHRYGFITLLVEPKTPWRYTVRELTRRNQHGVTQEIIAQKVEFLTKNFVSPMYYGFMISRCDSDDLKRSALKLARAVLQVDELRAFAEADENLLVTQFVKQSEEAIKCRDSQDLMHCTAFYTDFGKRPGVKAYETSEAVERNLGKLHKLEIRGLLITPRTISFRLRLNGEQLKFWNQVGEDTDFLPRGSRAHLTVATAAGIGAYVAGEDTLKFVNFAATEQPETTSAIALGEVRQYREDTWYLALKTPIFADSFFAAFYTRSRNPNATPRSSPSSTPSR